MLFCWLCQAMLSAATTMSRCSSTTCKSAETSAAQLRDAETGLAALHTAKAVAGKQAADVLWQDYGQHGTSSLYRLVRVAMLVEQTIAVTAPDGTELRLTSADPTVKIAAVQPLAVCYGKNLVAAVATS